MSKETNQNECAPAWGASDFESCKIEVLENGTYQVVNFTKTKVFLTGTYQECYVWVLQNHRSFHRSVLRKPAPKMSAKKKTSSVQMLREIYFKTGTLFETDFERAEEMHKEEIFEFSNLLQSSLKKSFLENAYAETFGGNNE